eukprot:scaffold1855_cov143-Isochrysis_galbana.AAC.2
MVVEGVGEEELSLFVECGKGGQPCFVRCEVCESLEGVSPNLIGVEGLDNHKVDYCLGPAWGPLIKQKLIHSPLEGKSRTLNTLAQAVVVHAALTSSPAYSGLKRKKGMGMGKEWGRGGGVSGRSKDRGCPAVTPLCLRALLDGRNIVRCYSGVIG